jgi:biopolymer transport protein ExbD
MKFRPDPAQEDGTFPIAPLIDIIFLLLVFFIATTAFQEIERRTDVNLPSARHGQADVLEEQQLIVNIARDGRYFMGETEWDLPSLRRRLKRLSEIYGALRPTVIVRADGWVPYQYVHSVVDACRGAGLFRLGFKDVQERQ